jgi:hypothetical protein
VAGSSGWQIVKALATAGFDRSRARTAARPVPVTSTPWSFKHDRYAATAVAFTPALPAAPGLNDGRTEVHACCADAQSLALTPDGAVELKAPSPPKPPGNPPEGRTPLGKLLGRTPEGKALGPAPGAREGRVTPCWDRQVRYFWKAVPKAPPGAPPGPPAGVAPEDVPEGDVPPEDADPAEEQAASTTAASISAGTTASQLRSTRGVRRNVRRGARFV